MKIRTGLFCAFLLTAGLTLPAAEYQNFKYEDAIDLQGKNEYRADINVEADGEYNLYFDANNASRVTAEVQIDGEKVPSLALPKTGRDAKTFRRLKLAAKVKLSAGPHTVAVAVKSPNAALTARALLVERVTVPHRWQLVWSDEFDDTEDQLPNREKWWVEEGFLRNNEAQYYTAPRLENLKVADGTLTITVRREPWKNRFYRSYEKKDWRYMRKTAEFTSANVNSRMAWQYGRIDVRFKMTGGKGLRPAVWTLGEAAGLGWPGQGEIDIMEYFALRGDRFANVLHIKNHKTGKHKQFGNGEVQLLDDDLLDKFHIASAVWDENKVSWYLDGVKTFEVRRDEEIGWDLENPQYFKANFAIGGDGGGKIDPAIQKADFVLDYVRIYQ